MIDYTLQRSTTAIVDLNIIKKDVLDWMTGCENISDLKKIHDYASYLINSLEMAKRAEVDVE